MVDAAMRDDAAAAVGEAEALQARGAIREAVDLLTVANRRAPSAQLERALVRLRRDGVRAMERPPVTSPQAPIVPEASNGELFEIGPDELSVTALRTGLARSGCLLVRGLVPPDRAAVLADGIDRALAAFDASEAGSGSVDPSWYSPFTMPDRSPTGEGAAVVAATGGKEPKHIPERLRRKFVRSTGGLWTAESPRMLFELFELVEDVGIGRLMVDFLGERPVLSANKCTLRRVPPEEVVGGWHQDGAFLGEQIGAFNFWVTLSRCGRDAPGLDIVPRRVDHVLASDERSQFDWSLSDEAVLTAAAGAAIVRPEFEPGDALLFDHLLVHRTAASAQMTRERHAIESWFFAPSAYPSGQLPLVF